MLNRHSAYTLSSRLRYAPVIRILLLGVVDGSRLAVCGLWASSLNPHIPVKHYLMW